MKRVVKLVEDIAHEVGYEFGNIWRPKDTSLCAVIPILRNGPVSEPKYYLLDDVKDRVRILESGSIGELVVELDPSVNKPVFVRGGTLFKGKGTQSRTLKYSVVLIPSKVSRIQERVPVLCVAETEPIITCRKLTYVRSLAPLNLHTHVIRGDQYALWHGIRDMARTCGTEVTTLINVIENLSSRYKFVEEVIKKIPVLDEQVGIALLDFEGVVGIEVFDSPISWKKLADRVSRTFVETLVKESPLFELRKDVAYEKVKEFLLRVKECSEYRVYSNEGTETYFLEGPKIVGEYVTLNDEIIHLMVFRRRGIPEVGRREREGIRTLRLRELRTYDLRRRGRLYRLGMLSPIIPHNYKSEMVMSALKEGPLTWKELLSRVMMAKATLSDRLKSLMKRGYVTKVLRDDGKEAYTLTAKGHEFVRRIERERLF